MTRRQVSNRVAVAAVLGGMALAALCGTISEAWADTSVDEAFRHGGPVENLLAPDTAAAQPVDRLDAPAPSERVTLTLGRGDTLVETLRAAGVAASEANTATRVLQQVIDLRRIQAGQTVTLIFADDDGDRRFIGAEIPRRDGGYAVVARDDSDGFDVLETDDPASLDLAGFGAAGSDRPDLGTAAGTAAETAAAAAAPTLAPVAAVDAEPDPSNLKVDRIDLQLGRGDTLAGLMTDAGVSATDAHYAIRALQRVENPRRLQPGQEVALVFERQGDDRSFLGLQLKRRNGRYAVVTRKGERGFEAISVNDLETVTLAGFGPVNATLPLVPVLIEQQLPSLAVVPPSTEDIDLAREHGRWLIAGTDDSAHEEKYLDFLSLRIEQIDQTVGRGDTLAGLMADAGVDRLDAHNAVRSLRGVFNPRRLRAGQEVTLIFENRGERRDFAGFELAPDIETRIVVTRTEDGGFAAESIANEFQTRLTAAAGTIDSSLYAASNGAGVPDPVLIAVIRAYSFEVDFQRDIRPGDSFELLFEQDFDEAGALARNGNVLYANLRLRGRDNPMYRFRSADGTVDYYDRDGQSVRRTLMRTPIDGARISSRYGMRRHPILGYSRMHRGTDFAAPTGTPIYAAGSGTIESFGRNGGYGRYIRIRHNGSLKTAYAHLSRYARGLGRGSRVQQGQVIGYVGTSGRSTGPHLHYEVMMEGRQVNPMTLDLPSGRKLEGEELAEFQRIVAMRDAQYAEAMVDVQVAQSDRD